MHFSFPQLNILNALKRTKVNKGTWLAIFAVVVLVLASSFYFFRKDSPEAEASWWDEGWYYRKALVVDYTKVDSELTNFPIAVQFNTTNNIYNNTNSDGSDLRFTDNNGNLLNYEIEKWNESGTSTVWVKLPTVYATASTTFYIYYGNPTATDAQTPTEVWDDNFVGVWHMAQDPSIAGASILDSTSKQSNGSPLGSMTTDDLIDGQLGQALDFDGSNDTINFGNGTDFNLTSEYTFSAWINYKRTLLQTLFAKSSSYRCRVQATSDTLSIYNFTDTTDTNVNAILTVPKNEWSYVSCVYDSTNGGKAYLNTSTNTGPTPGSGNLDQTSENVYLASLNNSSRFMQAFIDEARLSKVRRSDAWIKADYYSGLGTLYTQLSEEQGPGPVAYWSFDEGYGTTANDYSTGGNNGTITGATWKDSSECVKGKCLFFNDNGYVQMNTTTTLAKNNFTISAWFKTDSTADDKIISFGTSYHPLQILNGNFRVCMNGCSVGTRIFNDNIWHHALIVGDQSSIRVYVDGQLEITQGVTSGDMAGILRIGAVGADGGGTSPTYYFKGYIDEVKVYNYARSADQIRQDYNKGFNIALGQANQYNSLSDGLVGWWPMDEQTWNGTSGEVLDMSGNNTTGTATNANTTSTARFGRAGSFDGDSDYVELNNNSKIANLNSSSFTMAGWIRTTDITKEWQGIFGTDNSLSFFAIYLQSDVYAYTYMDGQVGNIRTLHSGANSIKNNTWYHIAATRDYQTGVTNLYLDGKLVDTFTALGNAGDPQNGLYLSVDGANSFKGQLDDMRIYNRALSADEVRRLSEWAPGPVLYMPLDEASGSSVYDKSGNNLSTTTIGSPTWLDGKYGSALHFNGSTQKIDLGNSSNLQLTNGTVEAWIKTSDAGTTYRGIVAKQNAYGMFLNDNVFGIYDWGGSGWHTSGVSLNDNQWHHVAFSFQSGIASGTILYIDGIPKLITTMTVSNQTASLQIGEANSNQYFAGEIDDIKIYNYVRNQRQILEDMNAGRPNNPVAYWSFDEGQGSYANDYSGYNHRGTLGCSGTGCSLPEWKTGVRNTAFYSDPATTTEKQCVSLTTTNLNISSATGTSVSMSVWLNASTTQISSGGGWVLRRGSGTDENYSMILVASGGKYKVKLEGYDGITFRSGTSNGAYITPGEWTHVVMIYKQGIGFDLYINGVFKETVSYPYINLTGTSFAIACGGGSNQSYNGYIDELKIYLYELTMDEIRKDYNFGLQNVLSQPAVNTQSAPTSSLAYWKFDDMTGTTAVDSTGNGKSGNFGGSPTWTVEGKNGGALSFNGSSDYVSVTNDSDLNFGTSSFSISYWTKSNYPSGTRGFIQKGSGPFNTAGTGWQLRQNGTLFEFARNNGGANPTRLSTSLSAWSGKWVNVIVTYNYSTGDAKLYVNGSYIDTVNYTGDYVDSYNLEIGRGNDGYFSGMIDDVKLYNYVLTDRDIIMEYNGGAPVGYWSFDEGQGETVFDRSGNGNNGTLIVGSGGTQSATSSAWANGVAGKINSSLSFDGSNDEVIMQGPELSVNATISGWFYWVGGVTSLIRDNTGGNGWILGYNSGDILRYRVGGIEFNTNINVSSLQNKWVHYAVTKNASTTNYYIDGVLKFTGTTAANVTSTMPWHIMRNGTIASYISGKADEIKIWNYALTSDEIKQEYNGGFSSFFR